jgi:hypothetical protein
MKYNYQFTFDNNSTVIKSFNSLEDFQTYMNNYSDSIVSLHRISMIDEQYNPLVTGGIPLVE